MSDALAARRRWQESIGPEIKRRLNLLEEFSDPESRAAAMVYLKDHPVEFINDWCWAYDPRAQGDVPRRMPFVLWPKQEELVEWVVARWRGGGNGLLKKGRDNGATYIMVLVAVWLWLFHDDVSVTFGSRKEQLVDRIGDRDTIFEKIRDVIDDLPAWMRPEGYERAKHAKYLNIVNPATGAVITGEAGDQMGRGGRSTIYFADEFAFVERAGRVDAAINDNADTVVYLSTSNGAGTLFHQKELDGHVPMFHFYWRSDPRKDEVWADAKRKEIGDAAFAREHEGDDYSALDRQIIQGEWVQAAQRIDLSSTRTVTAGQDIADEGDDENVFILRRGPVVELRPEWVWRDKLPGDTGLKAIRLAQELGIEHLAYDRVGVGSAVASELGRLENPRFTNRGIIGNAKCTRTYYDDDPRRPADERFKNLITELWWALRQRFIKTYEVQQARDAGEPDPHPEDECISIPDDARLMTQLTSRQYVEVEGGKLKAEGKKEMRKRGVRSPDRADALAYAFAPRGLPAKPRNLYLRARSRAQRLTPGM